MNEPADIVRLPPIKSDGPGGESHPGGADHPMRTITRRIVDDGEWTDQMRGDVVALFDELAPEWDATRRTPERVAALDDAFERTDIADWGRRCLELGCGTGIFTPALARRFDQVVAVDLSMPMLSQVSATTVARVNGDGARLPFHDHAFDTIVLVNMFLFPAEMDRLLAPGGHLVWFNSRGVNTPIHLPTVDVAACLPGGWTAVESERGSATWAVLSRSDPRI